MNIMDLERHTVGEKLHLDRHAIEAASWRLASELIRRHPDELYAIEMHPMSGQYDCLTVRRRRGGPIGDDESLFNLNRNPYGHVTPRSWFKDEGERFNWLDVALSPDLRREIVVPLEREEGLEVPSETPPTTNTSIGIRVIAEALAMKLHSRPLVALNGVLDSSGMGGSGVRWELVSSFDGLAAELGGPANDDLRDHPAYRYWFVVRDHEHSMKPVLAIDTWRGYVWREGLRKARLMRLYDECNRDIHLLVARLLHF